MLVVSSPRRLLEPFHSCARNRGGRCRPPAGQRAATRIRGRRNRPDDRVVALRAPPRRERSVAWLVRSGKEGHAASPAALRRSPMSGSAPAAASDQRFARRGGVRGAVARRGAAARSRHGGSSGSGAPRWRRGGPGEDPSGGFEQGGGMVGYGTSGWRGAMWVSKRPRSHDRVTIEVPPDAQDGPPTAVRHELSAPGLVAYRSLRGDREVYGNIETEVRSGSNTRARVHEPRRRDRRADVDVRLRLRPSRWERPSARSRNAPEASCSGA